MAPKHEDDQQKRGVLGRVVVLGGNGFLGHHIVNQAIESWTCDRVFSVDLRCDRNRNDAAEHHEIDITDTERLTSLFEKLKPDLVIHTVSPVASDISVKKEVLYKVNVEGTASVIEACQKASVKGLVYTSSASIISDMKNDLYNADEKWPVIRGDQQTEYYTETKAHAEELVLAANRADGFSLLTTAIRPAGLFGEGDVQNITGMLRVKNTGKHRIQLGDNHNIFDFTYVGNVAHSHLLAAQLLLATSKSSTTPLDYERVDGEAFMITNDEPVYFWDFARAIWQADGLNLGTEGVWRIGSMTASAMGFLSEVFANIMQKPPTFTVQRAHLACMNRYYNISKAKRVLKYKPLWTLQEGINRGVQWFQERDRLAAGALPVKAS